jgi:hypothetical protein
VSRNVLLGLLFAAALVALLIYSSLGTGRYRCEVCITFRGVQACRTARGATRELAQRTAIENTCAQLASGITDSTQCTDTPPDRITWLDGE